MASFAAAVAASGSRKRKICKHKQASRGRIDRLLLENFKSYEGYHEIGPFDKFTCIIGPNGAGKSNIMDAISFCLGIGAKHLRGDRLKDLVYKREDEVSKSNPRSAKVTIVFRHAQGSLLHFERTINAQGVGSYRFGPLGSVRNISHEDFLRQLAEQHIFVKARNFLVFQGDVMELARRQGAELASTIETISGSDQLKDEYQRLARELELAQERARMHFQHRREMEATVALLEKQRAEVERYQALRTERSKLASEAVLFKFFSADREEAQLRADNQGLQSQLSSVDGRLKVGRKELDEIEDQRRRLETEVDKATSRHYILSSNLEQLKPEISNCRKQTAHWSHKLEEADVQAEREKERLRGMEGTVRQVREKRVKAEKELAELQARRIEPLVRMTEEQRLEYEKAVARSDAVNSRARHRILEIDDQLAAAGRELSTSRLDLQELRARHARGLEKLEELAQERSSLGLELDRETAALQQNQKLSSSVVEDLQKFQLFKESLEEEQQSMRFKLDGVKARRERLEQVEARQRVADELRERFPDAVLGRLSELVLPAQRRFELPLQMALGGMAEAFVVTTAAVARECIKYLKVKMISSETFLPLDRIRVPDVGPLHLLVQGTEARRLATACALHNDKFFERHHRWLAEGPAHLDSALNFLLNGTIIADNLTEARNTAYQDARARGLTPRVVTLQGEVISPNGNMSVQCISAQGMVEFGGADQLREIKVQEEKLLSVENDLATLVEEIAKKRHQLSELKDQSRDFEDRSSAAERRLRTCERAQASEEKAVAGWAARSEELKANVVRTEGKANELERTKEALEADLLKVGKKHFMRLNGELGVPDVREAVQKEQRLRRRLREEVEQQEERVRGLQAEEKLVQQRVQGSSKLEALRRDIEQYRRDIQSNNERLSKLQEEEANRSRLLEASTAQVHDLKAQKEAAENEVKAKRSDLQQLKTQADEARKGLKRLSEKVRALLGIKCGMFRDCHERGVEIPLVGQKDEASVERMLLRERDLDSMPLQELEAICAALRIDFAALPADRKEQAARTSIQDAKVVEMEYETRIAEVSKELQGLNPNMRAVQECAVGEEKLRNIRKSADDSNLESQRLSRQFEVVKTERVTRFNKCFKHIETVVQPFYRALTSYDGCEGGSAYLDLDDAEEPYNGGITFTACPPGKRFFPMELLSGGEKSMASMSLLFAMHSYQPPPFMILDEVDAPFDRKNTNSLVSYLKKLDFQCLVISLKDTFFSHSDSIVGIFKDKDMQTSGSLLLPLRRLEEVGEENPLAEALSDDGV